MPAPIQDALIIGALVVLGSSAVHTILGRRDWLSFASLSIGVGGGLLTWALFLLSWAGIPLRASTLALAYGLLLILLNVGARRAGTGPREEGLPWGRSPDRLSRWMTGAAWTIIAILIAVAFCLSVGLSYYTWDAIANWSVKGYGIALEESILGGATWGSVGLSYPMNLPLLIATFRILDGDPWPGSKLLFPLLYASLMIGCYRFWRHQGLSNLGASLGTLLLAGTPIIFWHATSGYANLAFTCYLSLGVLWVIESLQDSDRRKTLMGGVLLALSIWTRPEGLLMCAGVLAVFVLKRVLSGSNPSALVPLMIPPMLVAASWIVFSRLHPAGAEAYELSSLGVKGLLAGDIRWASVVVIIRFVGGQVLRYRDWGYTLALATGLSLVGLRPAEITRDSAKATLILVIIVLSAIVFGAHYMAAYSPHGPGWVYEWLSLNFNRVFMPVGVLLIVLGILTFRRSEDRTPQNFAFK